MAVLTLIAAREAGPLRAALVQHVRDAVGGSAAPVWLSDGEAADLPAVRDGMLETARAALSSHAVDVLETHAPRRRCRLLVCDMDSTIVDSETLDDLAACAGFGEAVAAITTRSMNGDIDFRQALRERVSMLKGLPVGALEETWRAVRLMPGARALVATMRAHGATTALLSGGFTFFTARVAALCGFDHHRANVLIDDGTILTGLAREPILGADTKRETLLALMEAEALTQADCLAIGDGANDLPMLQEAGLAIAYRAKPVLAAHIANRIMHADLRAALFAQGYHAAQFVHAA